MKRYEIIGEPTFDLMEFKEGSLIFYDGFFNLISARIKELEEMKVYGEVPYESMVIIEELKNLIKNV